MTDRWSAFKSYLPLIIAFSSPIPIVAGQLWYLGLSPAEKRAVGDAMAPEYLFGQFVLIATHPVFLFGSAILMTWFLGVALWWRRELAGLDPEERAAIQREKLREDIRNAWDDQDGDQS